MAGTDKTVRRRRLAVTLAWANVCALAAVWALFHFGGDRWWFATCLLFAPRWFWALPSIGLIPAACAYPRRVIVPLAGALLMLAGPIMGLRATWPEPQAEHAERLRVLSFNLRGAHADRVMLSALIRSSNPDLVALQECGSKLELDLPPSWEIHQAGELVLAARHPLSKVRASWVATTDGSRHWVNAIEAQVDWHGAGIRFCNVHLETAGDGLKVVLDRRTLISRKRSSAVSDAIAFRTRESEDLRSWLAADDGPLVVAGDFNMPVESRIYRRHWADLRNAFTASGLGFGSTKTSTIGGLRHGLRIDHIVADPTWAVHRCWTATDIGSDHLPLLADLSSRRERQSVGSGEE